MKTNSEKNKIIPDLELTKRFGFNKTIYRIVSIALTACIIAQIIILIIMYSNLHILKAMAR